MRGIPAVSRRVLWIFCSIDVRTCAAVERCVEFVIPWQLVNTRTHTRLVESRRSLQHAIAAFDCDFTVLVWCRPVVASFSVTALTQLAQKLGLNS